MRVARRAVERHAITAASQFAVIALLIGIVIGAGFTWSAAGSPGPVLSCSGASRTMGRLEMLFGTSRPNGPPVSDGEWASFLDSEVTPRFPSGLTVLRGPGQWRSGDGRLAKEQAYIVVIWHEPTRGTEAAIEAIRAAYKTRFEQESVMRVDSLSCVSF